MREHKALLVILYLGIIFGGIIFGSGITGKIILDNYTTKPLCSSNSVCSNNEVCCNFYNDQYGVCDSNDMCPKILDLTKSEQINRGNWKNSFLEIPRQENLILGKIIFGGVIILLCLITYFIHFHYKDLLEKSNKKSRFVKKNLIENNF